MIVKLPIDSVDSFTYFYLLNSGYTRTTEVGIIRYDHPLIGAIGLRKLDGQSTEISFSYPYSPSLGHVIPIFDAVQIEVQKMNRGIEYPEYVKQKLSEEYNRRVATKRTLIDEYCKRINIEEERIRNISVKESWGEEQEINNPCEATIVEEQETNNPSEAHADGELPDELWELIPARGHDQEIIQLFCHGLTGREIGDRLHIDPRWIYTRISELRKEFPNLAIPYRRKKELLKNA